MKTHARKFLVLPMLAVLLAGSVSLAQDTEAEEPDEGDPGGFAFEIGSWVAQATGTGLVGATVRNPGNPFATRPLSPETGTQTELYYYGAFVMPRNQGKFSVNWYDHTEDGLNVSRSTPGEFLYGEVLAHPLFAGVNLDGLADAFSADFALRLTDLRLDYSRTGFESSRISVDWLVGWRRIKHDRSTNAAYSGLVPNFPPLLPPLTAPRPNLDPRDDNVSMGSRYEGRGLEAGLEFTFPLIENLLTVKAGFAVAALRGTTDVSYASTTNYYVLTELNGTQRILGSPYAELGQTVTDPQTGVVIPLATRTAQQAYRVGIVDRRSTTSMVLDTHVDLRWRLIKGLDLITGFRQTRYDDVGMELRPQVTTAAGGVRLVNGVLTGINDEQFTEIPRSATYEGFYFALGYAF